MRVRLEGFGVALRPHLKTAKCPEVARLALGGEPGPITVSTLREAEAFAGEDFQDILYAVGVVPARFSRIAGLLRYGCWLTVITDSVAVAEALATFSFGGNLRVLIEVDTGLGRAGVLPESPELLEIARVLHASPEVELRGVMTHAGHAYHCASVEAIRAVAEEERAGIVRAAERLREAGFPCPVVSAGSTPTAVHARDLTGVTEMRPGVYMFNDVFQHLHGCCTFEDIALSVLATVIGHARGRNRLLIDAGGLALSKDRSAADRWPGVGYGWVADLAGARIGDLHVADVSQEHGQVASAHPLPYGALPIGANVRIFPNHACMTAAAHDRYHVIENARPEVVTEWQRINGW